MLNASDIIFDKDLEMIKSIDGIKNRIRIVLSDGLYAAEEVLPDKYKSQIASFLNSTEVWLEKALIAIREWAKNEYSLVEFNPSEIELLAIFILYEQSEDEKYGLSFRVSFDEEHGCGLKISGNDHQVLEIGEADVAFC